MRSVTWTWFIDLALLALFFTLFANVQWGTIRKVEYHSSTFSTERKVVIYLPPGYSRQARYPVLYLLHGAGGDETTWQREGSVQAILDSLYAQKRIVPMIVVMPNCFVPPDRAELHAEGRAKRATRRGVEMGEAFEDDLLENLIPFIDAHLPTSEQRAIAGVSMGGGQALDIGTKHWLTFNYLGGFAPSFRAREPELLVRPPEARGIPRLLWVSCGDRDHLHDLNKSLHLKLEEQGVPHVWHVGYGAHEWSVWKDDLARFAQRLFRPSTDTGE